MNPTSVKVLLAMLPASLLLLGSGIRFSRAKTPAVGMQFVGASAVTLVVLSHVCEALHLFPGMHWGMKHSAGHYLDLVSAVLGLALFPTGYLLQALREGQSLS
jgi:hypothetical protein